MISAVASTREELRRRTAVLSHFEVDWLGSVDTEGEAVEALLLDDCGRVQGPDGLRHWALEDSVRRVVIARTPVEELRAAWRAVEVRPDDPQQWAIDRILIDRVVPDIDDAGPDRLRALEVVSRWLGPEALPGYGELRRLLRFRDLLVPLRAIATEHFVGRQRLLDKLEAGLTSHASPIVIHGFGGVGKSAVLARHLLNSLESHGSRISYLTFDNSALDPVRPASLISALAQQLALQLPEEAAREADYLGERARDRMRTGDRAYEVATRGLQVRDGFSADLLYELGKLTHDRPLAVAFDTLEEVQRRQQSALDAFVEFVAELQSGPNAKVVIAGRAPLPETGFEHVELIGLERAEAIHLLGHLTGGEQHSDVGRVVDAVGTSPLSLRLAAGILRRDGVDEVLRDLDLHRVGIEGVLYRRLLGHIPDRDVRRLAHPGLTLRRVTPDLIRRVLARPCGVRVPDEERARELFEGLAHEAMLVEPVPGDPWQVRHRTDVRRMMLRPLATEERVLVRKIHRAAVAYYKEARDVLGRAEGMYHRLMLGQEARTLDRYWSDDLVAELEGSIDELPPASKAYLAGHANLSVDPDDAREAELITRRRIVHRQIENLIGDGKADTARRVLANYRDETLDRSVLLDELEIQILELTEELPRARALAERRREMAARTGDTDAFLGFTHHVARLAERLGDSTAAAAVLAEASAFVRDLEPTDRRRIDRLRLAVAELARARRAGLPVDEELVEETLEQFEAVPIRAVRAEPGLLRDLAAEVGTRSPQVLRAALLGVGLGVSAAPEEMAKARDVIAAASGVEDDELEAWAKERERGELGRDFAEAIDAAQEGESEALAGEIADLFAVEADAAIESDPLSRLLAAGVPLTLAERRQIVRQAQLMIEQLYVHLPLKRAMRAVDPVQRLRLLDRRLVTYSDRLFHAEMISIFIALRDLHTNYILPAPFAGKIAFLPFRIEAFWEGDARRYLVTGVSPDHNVPPFGPGFVAFGPGVEVTHWNGIPIDRAVALNGERNGGSNVDARHARGLSSLTQRPMGLLSAPDEAWVNISFVAKGGVHQARFSWQVMDPRPAPTAATPSPHADPIGGALGLDVLTEDVRRAQKIMLAPYDIALERRMATDGASADELGEVSTLPDILGFARVPGPHGDLGYLRIWTFLVHDVEAYLSEVVRILELLPQNGLIVDVRGNGGGVIAAGELMLQLFTPRAIEPEHLHFVNTPLTFELTANAASGFAAWHQSIGEAVETGTRFSDGLPLAEGYREACNSIGQRYYGPVVLITDALCYSTTEIFSAGFQDHQIGPVMGSGNTGAGGANVWTYADVLRALPAHFEPLPKQASMRVAIRRTTRVGKRAGDPLEDVGVVPNIVYKMTRRDLLHANVDLIAQAGEVLDAMPRRALAVGLTPTDDGVSLAATTAGLDRLDVYVDERPVVTLDVVDGEHTQNVSLTAGDPHVIEVRGFSVGVLAASRKENVG